MGILIGAVVLMLGYGGAYIASEDVRYLTRAGLEQIEILRKRRPIQSLVDDTALDPSTRALLRLVLDARAYAADLGLEAGDTYKQFTDVGRDTLLLVLSASPKDCICPHLWRYPIVGRIPYKGFFDPEMARREEQKLSQRGFDTYLRPAGAYSTLGWFEDPLLSTAMSRDSVELAATVFHEIAHNTLYVKSATPFNESFAQMTGYQAAEEFFRSRGDSVSAERARDRRHDETVLAEFYNDLIPRLERFYASKPPADSLEAGRAAMGRWAREQLEGPVGARFRSFRVSRLAARPINNATLIGVRIYRTNLEWFDRWYAEHGSSVKTSVAALRALMDGAEGDSAFTRLGHAVGARPAGYIRPDSVPASGTSEPRTEPRTIPLNPAP